MIAPQPLTDLVPLYKAPSGDITTQFDMKGVERIGLLKPYQINEEVLAATGNPNCIFLHCLPAYRGYEVSADVIDGPQSVIWDEAENRLHAQKALMVWLAEQSA